MIEVTDATRELLEQRNAREQKAPELARQQQQRRGQGKAGGTKAHNVKRTVAKSRLQEAAAVHHVERGTPEKRWQPSYTLPGLPDPPGYFLTYIARHGRHRGDEGGLIKALAEHWEFARVSDFPEHILPTLELTKHGEVIGNDTSILMKLPLELKAQRDAHYNSKRDRATRQVNTPKPGLLEANDKMPLVEDINQVSTRMHRGPRRSPAA